MIQDATITNYLDSRTLILITVVEYIEYNFS
jgi:hypothetical protein